MDCVVLGATGYLGTRLIPQLLSAAHEVWVLARNPAKLDAVAWRDQVEILQGDVIDTTTVRAALQGQQALYYLGHCQLEQSEGDFRQFASAIHQVACDV